MKKLKKFDYLTFIKYFFSLICFLLLNNLSKIKMPFSVSLLSVSATFGNGFIGYALCFIASILIEKNYGLIPACAISVFVLSVVKIIYKSLNKKIKYESTAYTLISLLGFLFLGNTKNALPIEYKAICLLLSTLLTLIFYISINAISYKSFKIKMQKYETLSIIVSLCFFGVAILETFPFYIFKCISVLIILFTSYLFSDKINSLVYFSIGTAFAVSNGNLNLISTCLILGLVVDCFMPFSTYSACISVFAVDFVIQELFNIYPDTFYYILPDIISCTVFCLIPVKNLQKLKDKLSFFKEKQIVRQAINQNRTMLSNRLFELSSVFSEMSRAFNSFNKNSFTKQSVIDSAFSDVQNNICKNCSNFDKCKNSDIFISITKMIEIGLAKKRLSLIDMPSFVSQNCSKPNDILFGLNKNLSAINNKFSELSGISANRELMASESQGVSDILKNLALESGTSLSFQGKIEKILSDGLLKKGFTVNEILVFGDTPENITVSLVVLIKDFSINALTIAVGKILKCDFSVSDKMDITQDKIYLVLKRSSPYDAVFGIANSVKIGSEISGDTHSVIRINKDKFMVALSDGMGSGANANSVSSISLSLLESFYKAGMKGELILNSVNKLLAINSQDTFTALDVSVINLWDLSVDFIKYGSPYGFIVNDGGVKIIEGNSLPLGILENLKPTVCHSKLLDGDIVLLISDGVSDAFGSASDVIEFLRKAPSKNPQFLADEIIKTAVSLSKDKKDDDMTAIAVRIFKRDIA